MRLERIVTGALRDCIKAHGPITEQWLKSATKRVVGNIEGTVEANAEGLAVRRLRRRLDGLRHGHDRLVESANRWRSGALAVAKLHRGESIDSLSDGEREALRMVFRVLEEQREGIHA